MQSTTTKSFTCCPRLKCARCSRTRHQPAPKVGGMPNWRNGTVKRDVEQNGTQEEREEEYKEEEKSSGDDRKGYDL